MAVFSDAKRPLETSFTTKERRVVAYVSGENGFVLLEFSWMVDNSLIACARLIRRLPGHPTSKVTAVDYAFFPTVNGLSRPTVPSRLACFQVSEDSEQTTMNMARQADFCSAHDALKHHVYSLEPESNGHVVLKMLRNRAHRGFPSQWTVSVSPAVPLDIAFAPGSERQAVILRNLVLARIAQSRSPLCNPNKLFSCGYPRRLQARDLHSLSIANKENARCEILKAMKVNPRIISGSLDMEHLTDNDSASSDEDNVIDAPCIGSGPFSTVPERGDTLNGSSDSISGSTLAHDGPDNRLHGRPVAWCIDCQAYTSMSAGAVSDNIDECSDDMDERCSECGVKFSKRAVRARYWRAQDILASADGPPGDSTCTSANISFSVNSENDVASFNGVSDRASRSDLSSLDVGSILQHGEPYPQI